MAALTGEQTSHLHLLDRRDFVNKRPTNFRNTASLRNHYLGNQKGAWKGKKKILTSAFVELTQNKSGVTILASYLR